MVFLMFIIVLYAFICTKDTSTLASKGTHSFVIDFDNDQFLLDGKPFRYISGSVHYFRIHPDYWEDRLKRIRALGLNAIQFYVPWNYHEPYRGRYIFSHSRNITRFLEIAWRYELFVLLRLGPYTCAEWENGGIPWWLIKQKDIKMRTIDKRFTDAVAQWYSKLLPMLKPFLITNGGPIIMVQPENEYGSYYACDHNYTSWLSGLITQYFGSDIVQYTTDGSADHFLKCGSIPGVYPTIDFGPTTPQNIDEYFSSQRHFAPKGPLVNSEFYTGWFILWGQKSQLLPNASELVASSKYLFQLGASFNYYLVHGGTNFGFWSGAEVLSPVITSYDFSSPITEAGDITEKYLAIRDFLKSITDWPTKPLNIPENNPKHNYGKVQMKKFSSIDDLESVLKLKNCLSTKYPLSFEDLNHPLGFVLYTTKLKVVGKNLTIPILKDHGFTFLDGKAEGVFVDIFNSYSKKWLQLENTRVGSRLIIIVENRGRQTFETINDFKGILSNVTLDGEIVEDWFQCGISFKRLSTITNQPNKSLLKRLINKYERWSSDRTDTPGLYIGSFKANMIVDTFLDTTGWGKGVAFINGHNIGRYWPTVGPQITLYVPAPYLKRYNTIILFELEFAGNCDNKLCDVEFIDHSIFKWTDDHL